MLTRTFGLRTERALLVAATKAARGPLVVSRCAPTERQSSRPQIPGENLPHSRFAQLLLACPLESRSGHSSLSLRCRTPFALSWPIPPSREDRCRQNPL